MRNVFDQYSQPENRLTHALACALAEDPKLLKAFIRWSTGQTAARHSNLEILEQRLPGEPEATEEEAEQRGLPDAWIHDDEQWSLLIESKVSSPLRGEQLRRHLRTAFRRGFEKVQVLALDVERPKSLPDQCFAKTWTEVYTWLKGMEQTSAWAGRTARYMEIAETRWTSSGYLREGALTTFTGFPFDNDNPWNYREAKRLLRLALSKLRERKALQQQLGMDPKGKGRPAITGREGNIVWDFLPLRIARDHSFIKYPHLTLILSNERLLVCVTIPHAIKADLRRSLLGNRLEEFADVMKNFVSEFDRRLGSVKGAAPWVEVVQRHFPSQRSQGITDSVLSFDLHTAFPSNKPSRKQAIKKQPLWLETVYESLARKRGNLQVVIGGSLRLKECDALKTRQSLDLIERVWLSCKPIIAATVGLPGKKRAGPR